MPKGAIEIAHDAFPGVSGDLQDRFPIVPESALRATLGILERTVRRGLCIPIASYW